MTDKNENTVSAPEAVLVLIALVGVWFMIFVNGNLFKDGPNRSLLGKEEALSQTATLLIRFGNLGPELVSSGVIDREKFIKLYDGNDTFKKEAQKLLDGTDNGDFVVTEKNEPVVLNFLWALGLGNKNPILERGPMTDPRYGGAGNFASTGGWTIARGDAIEHYSMHSFIVLTPEGQALVERVAKNIYRPCCDNSTYFPDCNHGMAMLGFLELLASQGAGEEEMYKAALTLNEYWFPGTYEMIARYIKEKGARFEDMSPKEILGVKYSSASGSRRVASWVAKTGQDSGSSCGV
ncbi:MAG: hypothetical protein AAB428_02710 [Patescibacteria group bacterium]|mgnify:CR=1 FL=1